MNFVRCLALGLALALPVLSAWAQDMPVATQAADRYQSDIQQRFKSGSDPDKADALRIAGETAEQAGQTSVAISNYEQAVAFGGADYEIWHSLAKLNRDQQSFDQAVGAGWLAYQSADSPEDRAAALDITASALRSLDQPEEALAAYQLALDQTPDDSNLKDRIAELTDLIGLKLDTVDVERTGDSPSICLRFTGNLLDPKQVHYKDYVTVTPAFEPSFIASGNQLCINGGAYGTDYDVALKTGFPSAERKTLMQGQTVSIPAGVRDPSLGFDSNTYVLPRTGGQGVPLVSVNYESAKLELLRINDRNLIRQITDGRFLRVLDGYDRNDIANNLGETVWKGVVEIESKPNQRVVTAVPIDQILPSTQPGVYLLMAAPPEQTTADDWAQQATQWLIVTDIGMTSMSGADGLNLFVRSLQDGEAQRKVEVNLIARNNDILASTETDRDGLAHFDSGLLRGEGGREAVAVVASRKDGDFAFLDLTQAAFDLSDRGVGGRLPPGPSDLFLYFDRGVYRPSETVHLTGLLRDEAGKAMTGLPLTLKLLRPDGSEAETISLKDGGAGSYQRDIPVSGTARTGVWTVEAYLDPAGRPIASATYLVEEVVPARIEATLTADQPAYIPGAETTPNLDLTVKYLYGAMGAGLPVKGEAVVGKATDPFPGYPGFHFDLADEAIDPVRTELAGGVTDENGEAQIPLYLDNIPDTAQPLSATVRVEVADVGGRSISEVLELPIRNRPLALGIKPLFSDDTVDRGANASFEAIAVGDDGSRKALDKVNYRLVQEDWDYQWFLRNGYWDYQAVVRDIPGTTGEISIAADAPGKIQLPVDYGQYRLELYDPESGAAASYRFTAGWWARAGSGETPDTLQVTADKPTYAPGDQAELFVRPPFAGQVLLAVATDRIIATRVVDATPDGVSVKFDVDANWGAGAYVLATAFRPGSSEQTRGPGRAIGVAWLGIDPEIHRLGVTLTVPEVIKPRQKIDVPVAVAGLGGSGDAYVTLAAVDEGVLELTDFKTPDPVDYFFGKRRLGVDIRDLYGRLINAANANRGVIRSGGDAAMSRRAAPPGTTLVALFSGPVKLDADGKATISLDVPDYNGRLRLMAVAWNGDKVGAVETPLVVRDPLVALIATPRFLAPGDRSTLTVSLQNMEAPAGTYHVAITSDDVFQLGEGATSDHDLAQGTAAVLTIPLLGHTVGTGHITVAIEGPEGFKLDRQIVLGVRPAQLPEVQRVAHQLAPGDSFELGPDLVSSYLPGTGEVLTSLGGRPDFDLAGVLRGLDRYPYGCIEQTVSRALPLLYAADLERDLGLVENDDGLKRRVQGAIGRVLEMQRWDGSFALWDSYGTTEPWLSSYAMDFLTRARAKGYVVPDFAYKEGLDWLRYHAADHQNDSPSALSSRSYAIYVLASANAADPGLVRYMFDRNKKKLPSKLAVMQLGAALALIGDNNRAADAAKIALDTRHRWSGDDNDYYESDLRDTAVLLALSTEAKVPGVDPSPLIDELSSAIGADPWLSTQEQGWIVLAGAALGSSPRIAVAVGDGQAQDRTEPLYLRPKPEQIASGLQIANRGEGPIWANTTVFGVPSQPRGPVRNQGFTIERKYYTLAGEATDLSHVAQNDVIVTVVTIQDGGSRGSQALLIDLLPAGFELENVRLANARQTDQFAWMPELSDALYTEYLDDRFITGFESYPGYEYSFAYMIRAVTPGHYRVPAASVEDMYRPTRIGRGSMGQAEIEAAGTP
ncbi:MG2 domain-containing protein [Hypericibacter sp.]|uniref:alpha-2-macroglobulin family protein n=1 Tax=Hypericibacter sp. TaxID=2705401 RepID=UPI003D6D5B51